MVVKRPNRLQADFDFLLLEDSFETRNAAPKPRGIGIEALNEIVKTDSINKPINFINKQGS